MFGLKNTRTLETIAKEADPAVNFDALVSKFGSWNEYFQVLGFPLPKKEASAQKQADAFLLNLTKLFETNTQPAKNILKQFEGLADKPTMRNEFFKRLLTLPTTIKTFGLEKIDETQRAAFVTDFINEYFKFYNLIREMRKYPDFFNPEEETPKVISDPDDIDTMVRAEQSSLASTRNSRTSSTTSSVSGEREHPGLQETETFFSDTREGFLLELSELQLVSNNLQQNISHISESSAIYHELSVLLPSRDNTLSKLSQLYPKDFKNRVEQNLLRLLSSDAFEVNQKQRASLLLIASQAQHPLVEQAEKTLVTPLIEQYHQARDDETKQVLRNTIQNARSTLAEFSIAFVGLQAEKEKLEEQNHTAKETLEAQTGKAKQALVQEYQAAQIVLETKYQKTPQEAVEGDADEDSSEAAEEKPNKPYEKAQKKLQAQHEKAVRKLDAQHQKAVGKLDAQHQKSVEKLEKQHQAVEQKAQKALTKLENDLVLRKDPTRGQKIAAGFKTAALFLSVFALPPLGIGLAIRNQMKGGRPWFKAEGSRIEMFKDEKAFKQNLKAAAKALKSVSIEEASNHYEEETHNMPRSASAEALASISRTGTRHHGSADSLNEPTTLTGKPASQRAAEPQPKAAALPQPKVVPVPVEGSRPRGTSFGH